MLDAYDFTPCTTLVDVGGGNGSLLCAVLRRYPALRGVLYDRPDVVERARPNLKAAGLEDRCAAVGGSFFTSVPPGGDAYLMRHIIHDWDDERCQVILGNCRKVLRPGGRVLVIETVIPPGNEASFTKFLDVNMLAIPGGKERTETEYRDLFAAAGFRLARVVPTAMEVSVIEGEPL
jgi:ubiquinone/menaquinone biosynthesis C-methylase UbiE